MQPSVNTSVPAAPPATGDVGSTAPAGADVRLLRWAIRRAGGVRGRPVLIDERIGVGYLGSVVLERSAMAVRGLVRFPARTPRPFVGRGVRLRAKRRLSLGRGV